MFIFIYVRVSSLKAIFECCSCTDLERDERGGGQNKSNLSNSHGKLTKIRSDKHSYSSDPSPPGQFFWIHACCCIPICAIVRVDLNETMQQNSCIE